MKGGNKTMSLPALVITTDRLAALTSAVNYLRSKGDNRMSDVVRTIEEMLDSARAQDRDRTHAAVPWFMLSQPRPRR